MHRAAAGWRTAVLLAVSATAGVQQLDQWDENARRAYAALRAAPLPQTPPVRRQGSGVVYAVGGSEEFFDQEVVPCVTHLARLETESGPWRHLTKRTLRFMLFHEHRQRSFKKWDLVQRFFDATEAFEDKAPVQMTREKDPRVRVKSIKAWAFYRAPFERFVYLDFDSRPCTWDAPSLVLAKLAASGKDALLHNQWPAQAALQGSAHFRCEHHSAVAAFRTTAASEAALKFFVDAFQYMKLKRDQPALMVALRLAVDRAGFAHTDVDNATFCRAGNKRPVSCDAGCLLLHKPMKYDAANIVVSAGRRGQGGTAVKRALAALKLVDRDARCAVSETAAPDFCRVLIHERYATPEGAATLLRRYPRARFVVPAAPSCGADRDHVAALQKAGVPAHALFELDLRRAADAGRPTHWRDFCAFVEAWSSCKTQNLARVANAWLRRATWEDAWPGSREACVSVV